MNDLPQELVERICEILPWDTLKSALLVSRKFQYAAERASKTFARFTFKDHSPKEHQDFVSIFSGHRFDYLRVIEIHTEFPALEPKYKPSRRGRKKRRPLTPEPDGSCRESLQNLKEKDELFTSQIAKTFEAIKSVEDVGDNRVIGKKHLVVFTPRRQVHKCYCNHRLFSSWRVHLLSPDRLPRLRSINGLHICNLGHCPERKHYSEYETAQSRIDLRALVDLAARCPNLEYLGCELGVDEWTDTSDEAQAHYQHDYEGPLRDTRNDFAHAVQNVELPSSLRHVELNFIKNLSDALSEQLRPLPNLVAPKIYDPFSSSLRLLSSHLKQLELRVMADKTLFWPHDGSEHFWPNLECLNVMLHIGSPSGEWYFQGPSEEIWYHKDVYIEEEPDYPPLEDSDILDELHPGTPESSIRGPPAFRIIPIEETISPVLESFARATSSMLKLKRALIWVPLMFYPEDTESEDSEDDDAHNSTDDRTAVSLYPEGRLTWSIQYVAPQERAFDGGENKSSCRKLLWEVGKWRPSEELHKLFQDIGEIHAGGQLIEEWIDLRDSSWRD
ncbi:hypothetical protein BS50DRAFT_588458 [Corynespora cassiicola Philippines]|uniref:F-box domain-containing protein n=1 Tax=Corynespora cassiicola Philippines TaxID=1448308 RepID=A0A2T2NPX7_CORCC|nr:hypothetical protein BS50DRAFT_588458 [Corynespora cassiicola Philippines]